MSFQRSDYERLHEKSKGERRDQVRVDRMHAIRQAAQAEVPLSLLTQSTEWDYFLSLMQAQRDKLEAWREVALGEFVEEESCLPDHLLTHKMRVNDLTARIATIDWILELPKQALETAREALSIVHDDVEQS